MIFSTFSEYYGKSGIFHRFVSATKAWGNSHLPFSFLSPSCRLVLTLKLAGTCELTLELSERREKRKENLTVNGATPTTPR